MDIATQTDDFLNNRQLTEIATPSSDSSDKPPIPLAVLANNSEHGSADSQTSPGAHVSMEVELGHKCCFKCRCKAKFKHMVQTGSAGAIGTAIGALLILLL